MATERSVTTVTDQKARVCAGIVRVLRRRQSL